MCCFLLSVKVSFNTTITLIPHSMLGIRHRFEVGVGGGVGDDVIKSQVNVNVGPQVNLQMIP